jgi:hypothetical protein
VNIHSLNPIYSCPHSLEIFFISVTTKIFFEKEQEECIGGRVHYNLQTSGQYLNDCNMALSGHNPVSWGNLGSKAESSLQIKYRMSNIISFIQRSTQSNRTKLVHTKQIKALIV